MSLIARLGVNLALNSSEFMKGLDDATKKTKDFEYNQRKQLRLAEQASAQMLGFVGSMITAAASIGTVLHAFQHADEIMDTAKAFDITVTSLLATQKALQLSGGEAENVTQIFSKLAQSQENAQTGNEAMRESFAKLGISGKDVDNLKLDDLFKRVAVELAGMEDATKRNAIAQELLGKAAKGIEWGGFIDEYKQAADPSIAYALNENAKAWDNIEKAVGSISKIVQVMVMPLAAIVNMFDDLINTWEEIKKGSDVEIDWAGGSGEQGATTFHKGAGKKKAAASIAMPAQEGGYSQKSKEQISLEQKLRGEIVKANEEYQKKVSLLNDFIASQSKELSLMMQRHSMNADDYEIAKKQLELNNQITKLEGDKAREIKAAYAEYNAQSDKEKNSGLLAEKLKDIDAYYKKAIPAQKELNQITIETLQKEIDLRNKYIYEDLENQKSKEKESIMMHHDAQMEMLDLESQSYKLSTNEYNLRKLKIEAAQQLADIETKYAEKRKALQVEFERTAQTDKDRELFNQKIKDLDYLQRTESNALTDINNKREDNFQKEIERQQSWSAGWDEAMKQYSETAERASERGRAAFESVTSNMESAIRKFVDTGKFAFKDFVGSVIKDLIYMEMRAQASTIFRAMWSSLIGSLGTPSVADTGSAGKIAGDLFGGHAAGGYVDSPSIVGENGAELFVPSRPGTIIPNGSWQQMAAAGSGGSGITVNGNYIANMSAIDTQSATQFLAKNKTAIWASYQSANRSVPISR